MFGPTLTVLVLELVLVHVEDLRVRFQQVVAAQVAGNAGVVDGWRHKVLAVRLLADVPRFVKARPKLNAIAELLEQNLCVVGEDVD